MADSSNRKWLFVSTAMSGIAYVLPSAVLKPLLTYLGLPLDSEPAWWTVLAAVLAAALMLWLVLDFRRQGATRIVALGPLLFIALSQLAWLLFFRGIAATGASPAELEASASLSWPLWLLVNGLFGGAGIAGAYLAHDGESAPPSKELMIASWVWAVVGLFVTAAVAWGHLTVREILENTGV